MDGGSLHLRLDKSTRAEFGALNPHIEILHAFLQGKRSPKDAAEDLVSDVSAEPMDPESDRTWRVWQLLLSAATELPKHHQALVELVLSVQATAPENLAEGSDNRLIQRLWEDWRDHFDGLKTYSHLRQKQDVEPVVQMSGSEKYITFSAFSAKLVYRGGAPLMHNIGAFAFFELRDVLETTRAHYAQDVILDEDTTTVHGARSADLEAACQWIIHGDRAILDMSNSSLAGFEGGIGKPTDFWTGAPGLSEGRWRLWQERLETCLAEEELNGPAKAAIRHAVGKISIL